MWERDFIHHPECVLHHSLLWKCPDPNLEKGNWDLVIMGEEEVSAYGPDPHDWTGGGLTGH
jgi:hypothetical protein